MVTSWYCLITFPFVAVSEVVPVVTDSEPSSPHPKNHEETEASTFVKATFLFEATPSSYTMKASLAESAVASVMAFICAFSSATEGMLPKIAVVAELANSICQMVGAVAQETLTVFVEVFSPSATVAAQTVKELRLDAPVPPFATGRIPSACSFSLTFCAIFIG